MMNPFASLDDGGGNLPHSISTRIYSSSRRALLKMLASGTAASTVWGVHDSPGEEPAKLDENGPKARALGYVENAARLDTKRYPAYVPGSNCGNCLQLQGKPGNRFRPCTLFPGRLVSVGGWCTRWTAEL